MPIEHTVAEGECISSIAHRYGFFPSKIWGAPENEPLRRKRKNPNLLVVGDVVFVPDQVPGTASVPTGRVHRFRRKGVPERLRFQFLLAGFPRAEEPYEIEVDGAIMAHGAQTDAEGRIDQAIPPDARSAKVRFYETGEEYDFALGRLEPIDTQSGAQGRLKSLGFYTGALDGQPSAALSQAIERFQGAHDLEISGELDDATRAALESKYGG